MYRVKQPMCASLKLRNYNALDKEFNKLTEIRMPEAQYIF